MKVGKNHFFFELDSEKFRAGTTVEGIVVLVIQSDEFPARSVKCRWVGKEFTKWFQGIQQKVQCTQERIIFSSTSIVWHNNESILKKGTYSFPVSFDLPERLPSSFADSDEQNWFFVGGIKSLSSEKSFINYTATVSVDDEANNSLIENSLDFRVVEEYRKDLLPIEPLVRETEKTFLTIGMQKLPIKLKVTLPLGKLSFSGYRIPVTVDVKNSSNKKIEAIYAHFAHKIVLIANSDTLTRKKELTSGQVPQSSIEPQGNYLNTLMIDVPEFVPSVAQGSLIQHEYELIIELKGNVTTGSLLVTLPIVIFDPMSQPEEFLNKFTPNNPSKVSKGKQPSDESLSDLNLQRSGSFSEINL